MSTIEDWAEEGGTPPEDWVPEGEDHGPNGLSAVTEGDREACIAEIHKRATRFMRRKGVVLEIADLDKREFDGAIDAMWHTLEELPFSQFLGESRMGSELPPKLAFFLFYAVVAARYRFELPKLHDEAIPPEAP